MNGNALLLPHILSMTGSPLSIPFLWTTCHKKPYPHLSPIVHCAKVGKFGQEIPPLDHILYREWPKASGHVGARPLHLQKLLLPPHSQHPSSLLSQLLNILQPLPLLLGPFMFALSACLGPRLLLPNPICIHTPFFTTHACCTGDEAFHPSPIASSVCVPI